MKHGSNSRRGRSRNNGKRHPSAKSYNFESSGPDIKVRGTAQQVLEKYLALARDASSAGDRISAENFFQHAEHYYRILNTENPNRPNNGQQRPPGGFPSPAQDGLPPDVDGDDADGDGDDSGIAETLARGAGTESTAS